MKVHIFQSENIYSLSLLDLLYANFDLSDHIFIFRSRNTGKNTLPGSVKVHYLPGFRNLFKIKKILSGTERIYFHLLPMGPDVFFWYLNKKIFANVVWIYWGADIYEYRLRNTSIKHLIYEQARRHIIPIIPDIAGFLKGDFELIKSVYCSEAIYHHVVYPIPTNFELCDKLQIKINESGINPVNVIIGNSGNESNRHLEAFRILKKFRNEDLNIYCPLSYGARKRSYIRKVINEGRDTFGSKFIPLLDFMKPEDYLNFLNETDIVLMNHDRQQGLGNSLSLLYLGKKIYLRKDTTSFEYFSNQNIKVFDILSIEKSSFQDFASFNKSDGHKNQEIIKSEFSKENYIKKWKHILDL